MSDSGERLDEKTPLTCSDCDIGFTFDPDDVCDYCGGSVWEAEPGYE